jgi:hypothetical protein
MLKEVFLENFLTNQLSEQDLTALILALHKRNYPSGEIIIQ